MKDYNYSMVKKNKKITTLNELVGIMLGAFDSNQKYMDKKFDQVDKKFEHINKNFKEVNKKIDNISLNIVDVVRKDEFDKLKSRVINIEEAIDLPSKKN